MAHMSLHCIIYILNIVVIEYLLAAGQILIIVTIPAAELVVMPYLKLLRLVLEIGLFVIMLHLWSKR